MKCTADRDRANDGNVAPRTTKCSRDCVRAFERPPIDFAAVENGCCRGLGDAPTLRACFSFCRGGLGMTEALLELLPDSPVYHVGMYRNPGSNIPVQYYNRLPKGHPSDVALVLDPVIASCEHPRQIIAKKI